MIEHAQAAIASYNASVMHDLSAEKIRLIMKLRRIGVTDTRVLGAMETVPRELFVEPAFMDRAYDDNALPIAKEQTISQPSVVALMTQALKLEPRHIVLEVGTGSGYQAAILSQLARRVHTIEYHRELYIQANQRFESLRLRNITTHLGDGAKGWAHAAPYERIIVTCAAVEEPPALLEQLADGGIMIIPLGEHVADQELFAITRNGSEFITERLFPVRFVPLV